MVNTKRNCLMDYNFIGQYIEPEKVMNFIIAFQMDTEVLVESNITVLEVDFYYGSSVSLVYSDSIY